MLFTYHCEGSPTVFARLKFSIKSWLILASWSILFMSCLYNPGMFLHSLSNKRAAVGLKVKYPNATATALRTSSLDDDNFFTSSSMAPVVTMASGIPARVWARLESKLLASTITLSLSEFNLRTSIVTPLAVKSTWSLSTMTRANTTICKKNKTDHKASVRIKLIFTKMCILVIIVIHFTIMKTSKNTALHVYNMDVWAFPSNLGFCSTTTSQGNHWVLRESTTREVNQTQLAQYKLQIQGKAWQWGLTWNAA